MSECIIFVLSLVNFIFRVVLLLLSLNLDLIVWFWLLYLFFTLNLFYSQIELCFE